MENYNLTPADVAMMTKHHDRSAMAATGIGLGAGLGGGALLLALGLGWGINQAIKAALDTIKSQNPELYADAMRELYLLKHGPHYDEDSARQCVREERYTYSDVIAMTEHYISMMSPADTMWNAYVAINRWYSDLGRNYERRGGSSISHH